MALHIHRIDQPTECEIAGLCDVLVDCVEGEASVSFMAPMTQPKAEAFWRKLAARAAHSKACRLRLHHSHNCHPGTCLPRRRPGLPESSPGIRKNESQWVPGINPGMTPVV